MALFSSHFSKMSQIIHKLPKNTQLNPDDCALIIDNCFNHRRIRPYNLHVVIDLRHDVGEGSPLPTSRRYLIHVTTLRRDQIFESHPIHPSIHPSIYQNNPYFVQKIHISHINHHNPDTLSGINRQFLTYY